MGRGCGYGCGCCFGGGLMGGRICGLRLVVAETRSMQEYKWNACPV